MIRTACVTLTCSLGCEHEVEVEGHWTPPIAARLCGPPEDCYPAEPAEFEPTSILVDGRRFDGDLTDEQIEACIADLTDEDDDGPPWCGTGRDEED